MKKPVILVRNSGGKNEAKIVSYGVAFMKFAGNVQPEILKKRITDFALINELIKGFMLHSIMPL